MNPTSGDGLNFVRIRSNSPGPELDKLYDLRIDRTNWPNRQGGGCTPGWKPMALGTRCHQPQYRRAVSRRYRHQLHRLGLRHRNSDRISPADLALSRSVRLSAHPRLTKSAWVSARPDFTFLPPTAPRPRLNVYFPRGRQPISESDRERDSNPEYAYDPQGRLSPFTPRR